MLPTCADFAEQSIAAVRWAKQAYKADGRLGKTLEILPVAGEVVTHYDNGVEPIQFQGRAEIIDRDTQNRAVLTLPQTGNVCRSVIYDCDTPTEGTTETDQWFGILPGAKYKDVARP